MLCVAGMAAGVSAQPFVGGIEGENAQPDPFFRPPPMEANFAQAMPMPDDSGIPATDSDLNSMRPVYYDVRTGVETIGAPVNVTVPMASGEEPALPGLLGDGDEGFGSRNFNALSLISNPDQHPWNNNCKLLMRFGSSYFVCSGTLIDRRTVLTAGHCVHEGNGGSFADEIWVFPGYENADGNNGGLPFTDESDWPFGSAKSQSLVTWSGWASSGDFNVDQGYMRLDRPIGFITGSFGYGYNTSCSYFTGNTFNNASYPAEAAYGWTGNFMYYRFGTFDSCPSSNRAQYNSAGYGGMSGSSSYSLSGSNRIAYGVASTSDRQTYTRHVNFWQGAFEYVRDTFIQAAQPSTSHDLWAMWTRGSASSVTAGNSITANAVVGNWSQVAYNGSTNYDYRLSTNDFISSGDTLLASGSFSFNYGTTGSVFAPTRTLTIPKSMPTGDYWVGLLLNHSDASSSNNDSSGQDAWDLHVNGVADPAITAYQASTGQVFLGDTMQIQYIIQNLGGDPSNTIDVSVRASTNTIISTADPEVASFSHSGLNGGSSFDSGVVNIIMPTSLGEGNRYVGIIISSSNDVDTSGTSNVAGPTSPITLVGRPDVAVSNFNADNGTYYHGQTVSIPAFTISNAGTAATGTIPLEVRVSTNNFISSADTLARTGSVSSHNPGDSTNYSWSFTVPSSLTPGDYYAGLRVPTLTNEVVINNNWQADEATFTIIDCLPDVNNDGAVNSADFSAWIAAFNSNAFECDQNGDGACTPADFSAWIANFNAGCPGL